MRYRSAVPGRRLLESLRLALFVGTGLAVPLYAFPLARVLGRDVDSATILAALFVLVSLAAFSPGSESAAGAVWLAAAAVVPFLALAPASPGFDFSRFAVSYGHWILLAAFFFSSLLMPLSGRDRRRIASVNFSAGVAVALFALYQSAGAPRGWPGTGPTLVAFQREPFRMGWIGRPGEPGSYARPTSVFLEPAWMGGYLAWICAIGAALLFASAGRLRRILLGLGLAAVLLALAASVSWGAYADLAAAGAAALVSLLLSRRLSIRRLAVPATAAVLLLAILALSPLGRRIGTGVYERWAQLKRTPIERMQDPPPFSDSSWARVRNLTYTAELFRSNAARGIGLGQFAGREMAAAPGEDSATSFRRDPWCGWVAVAAQMGFLGPLLLLSALVLVVRRWWRDRADPLAAVAVPALVAVALVAQLHTGSFLDLWWWYPVSIAAVLSGRQGTPFASPGNRSRDSFTESIRAKEGSQA